MNCSMSTTTASTHATKVTNESHRGTETPSPRRVVTSVNSRWRPVVPVVARSIGALTHVGSHCAASHGEMLLLWAFSARPGGLGEMNDPGLEVDQMSPAVVRLDAATPVDVPMRRISDA